MSYFIALRFLESDLSYSKIHSFRKRFDPKYTKYKEGHGMHLSILPPFDLGNLSIKEFDAIVSEEVEMALAHLDHFDPIVFKELDFAEFNQFIIFSRPTLSPELHYFAEGLYDILTTKGVIFKKRKAHKNTPQKLGIPLGRSSVVFDFDAIVDKAREEFNKPFNLRVCDLVLYEKVGIEYVLRKKFFTFLKTQVTIEEDINWYGDLRI